MRQWTQTAAEPPKAEGIYAVTFLWNDHDDTTHTEAGVASFFTATQWSIPAPVIAHAGPFASHREAQEWAWNNPTIFAAAPAAPES